MADVTVVGNLTAVPELRFTQAGKPFATFTVASSDRVFRDGEWRDGDPVFVPVTVWGEQAERVAQLAKGQRVVVAGRLRQREWEAEGGKRSRIELDAHEVAPSLKFGPVRPQEPVSRDFSPGSVSDTGAGDLFAEAGWKPLDEDVPF